MKSVAKRNIRKSQREAARLKRQVEPDPAMEEDEEVEVHFNQAQNTPDTPRVSRNNRSRSGRHHPGGDRLCCGDWSTI